MENTFCKYKSFEVESSLRILKVYQFSSKTCFQAGPFGEDSVPMKDDVMVYLNTSADEDSVAVGCLNNSNLAQEGEVRRYSKKSDGSISTYVWLKNDETLELGGASDSGVLYGELKRAFDQLKNDFNSLVNLYNTHVHVSNGTPTVSTGTPSSADMSSAKSDIVKLS